MDQLLGIETTNSGKRQNQPNYYHQHEVTPYWMISSLFDEYTLKETDEFVDFGSGHGRMLFYVHHQFRSTVKGIEMNDQLYQKALQNRANYIENREDAAKEAIRLKRCLAEEYEIKETQNRFYFFNPFSVEIFNKVVQNILTSFEEHKREMDIILYYPSSDYIDYLETDTPFQLVQNIKVPGVYNINNRERFVVFRLEA